MNTRHAQNGLFAYDNNKWYNSYRIKRKGGISAPKVFQILLSYLYGKPLGGRSGSKRKDHMEQLELKLYTR